MVSKVSVPDAANSLSLKRFSVPQRHATQTESANEVPIIWPWITRRSFQGQLGTRIWRTKNENPHSNIQQPPSALCPKHFNFRKILITQNSWKMPNTDLNLRAQMWKWIWRFQNTEKNELKTWYTCKSGCSNIPKRAKARINEVLNTCTSRTRVLWVRISPLRIFQRFVQLTKIHDFRF